MAITLADFNKIWASTSPLTPYSFSESNYKQGWNFIGSTPPARQMWDYLQKNNDEKMQYLANNYLPLTGGTMSGGITFGISDIVKRNGNDSYVRIYGGTGISDGASLSMFGENFTGGGGLFYLRARTTADGNKDLLGKADGTLTWGGNNIITSAGGTFSGAIISSIQEFIKRNVNNNHVVFMGGTSYSNSASLVLRGGDESPNNGGFQLKAQDGSSSKDFIGKPDGTLTWDGQPIQTSSDKRLKQDFSAVPAEVLEAWGKVNWQQFKYKDDVKRKGDFCRFHTGLVAQDVKEVGEANHVDLLKYGILCHDVREAVEEEKDENGNVIQEASEAVDLWTVRYEEALAMEVIYLRNEIKKLREEIKALRTE